MKEFMSKEFYGTSAFWIIEVGQRIVTRIVCTKNGTCFKKRNEGILLEVGVLLKILLKNGNTGAKLIQEK